MPWSSLAETPSFGLESVSRRPLDGCLGTKASKKSSSLHAQMAPHCRIQHVFPLHRRLHLWVLLWPGSSSVAYNWEVPHDADHLHAAIATSILVALRPITPQRVGYLARSLASSVNRVHQRETCEINTIHLERDWYMGGAGV